MAISRTDYYSTSVLVSTTTRPFCVHFAKRINFSSSTYATVALSERGPTVVSQREEMLRFATFETFPSLVPTSTMAEAEHEQLIRLVKY